MSIRYWVAALAVAAVGAPGPVWAAVACGASPPAAGATVRGPVLQVMDARTLCVALGPLPQEWLQVKLKAAPGVRAEGLFAQTVTCRVTARQAGFATAACAVATPGAATF